MSSHVWDEFLIFFLLISGRCYFGVLSHLCAKMRVEITAGVAVPDDGRHLIIDTSLLNHHALSEVKNSCCKDYKSVEHTKEIIKFYLRVAM